MGGRLFEAKQGYLQPGDTLRIVNHSGYVAPPKNWEGTEFEPWAKAYLRRYKHKGSVEARLYSTDWLSSADLTITRIHKDGSYEGVLGNSRGIFGLDNEGDKGGNLGSRTYRESFPNGPTIATSGQVVMSSATGIHCQLSVSSSFSDTSIPTGPTSEFGIMTYIKPAFSGQIASMFAPNVMNNSIGTTNMINMTNHLYNSGGADASLTPAQHLALMVNATTTNGGNASILTEKMVEQNEVYDSTHPFHNEPFMIDVNNVAVSNSTMMLDTNLSDETNSSIENQIFDVVQNKGITLSYIPLANLVAGQDYDMGFSFANINNYGYDCDIDNDSNEDLEVNMLDQTIEFAVVEKHSSPYTTLKANNGATDLGAYLVSNGWTEPVYAVYGSVARGDIHFEASGTSLGTMSSSTPSLQLNNSIQVGTTIDQPIVGTASTEVFSINHSDFVDVSDGDGLAKPNLDSATGSVWPEDVLSLGDEIANKIVTQQFFTGNGSMSNFATLTEFPFLARVENSNTAVTNDEEEIGIMNPLEVVSPAPSSSVQTDSGDLDISFMTKTAHTNLPSGTIKIYLKNDVLGINEHLVDDQVTTANTYNVTIAGSTLATAYNGGVFPSSSDYYVQIESVSGSSGAFSRGYYFSIRANITEIDITSPVGGTDFNQGESVTITWEAQNNLTDTNDPQ